MDISLKGVSIQGTINKYEPEPIDYFIVSERDKETVTGFSTYGFSIGGYNEFVVSGAPSTASMFTYNIGSRDITPISSKTVSDGRFGYRVAMTDTWIVTATAPTTGNGKVYVYRHTNGIIDQNPTQIITHPAMYPENGFAYSVAIHGNTMVIGHTKAAQCGAVHIYEYTTTWNLVKTINISLANAVAGINQNIGFVTAVTKDFIIAGGPGDITGNGNGMIMMCKKVGGTWGTPTYKSLANTLVSGFGFSLSVNETTAIVGAPALTANDINGAVMVFDIATETLTATLTASRTNGTVIDPESANNNRFGNAIAIHSTKNIIAVGSMVHQTNKGVVYTFEKIETTWNPTQSGVNGILKGSGTSANSRFGSSVVFSGNRLVVGAYGITSLFLFN